jgi:hypothetical protein
LLSDLPREATEVMTASDVVARVRISDIAEALGVKLDRARRRGVAHWRDGRNFSVSLNDEKNCWHDFVTNEGGGLLDFISRILVCDRQAALRWLADYAGVALDHENEDERRARERRMRTALPAAEALVDYKVEILEALREKRNLLLRIFHGAEQFIINHDVDECERRGDLRFEAALAVGETYWQRIQELDQQIDRLEAASYADLLRGWGFTS